MTLMEAAQLLEVAPPDVKSRPLPEAQENLQQWKTTTLKKAYRRAVLRTHPDRGGTEEAFHAVQQAYELLRASRVQPPQRRAQPGFVVHFNGFGSSSTTSDAGGHVTFSFTFEG